MKCQISKFFLSRKTAYINCAYMSPMMKKVANAGKKGIMAKAQPYKIIPHDFFKEVDTIKILFAKLINCPENHKIAKIPSVSYGMETIAKNFKLAKGQNIVVNDEQFSSNYYVWRELCYSKDAELKTVKCPVSLLDRGQEWNEKLLEAIDSQTRLVAMAHVHWSDGTLFDLKAVRKKCNEVGAMLIIDGSQSIVAFPFDVQEIKPDALISTAYKWLMGPYGSAFAHYGKEFDQGKPLEYNWIIGKDSMDFADLVNYSHEFELGARFDMGEKSNFIGNPMLIEALKQVIKWGPDNIQNYCEGLLEMLSEMGYKTEDKQYRSSHVLGIQIGIGLEDKLKKAFNANHVSVSIRGNFVRISPHVCNDGKDMDKLVQAFKSIGRH